MTVDGSKIMQLIAHHGREKGYPEKSYIPKFCEDYKLNYVQWAAYTRGAQNLGMKILDTLINIFPDLNLNWLLKEDESEEMFTSDRIGQTAEPSPEYIINKKDPIMKKLEEMHKDIKNMNEAWKVSHN